MSAAQKHKTRSPGRRPPFDLDAVKAIPIRSVAVDLGFVLNSRGHGRCKLPGHEDKNPSFSLLDRTNHFKCHGCGRGGSVVDLLMDMDGMVFVDACKWLQDHYLGGPQPRVLNSPKQTFIPKPPPAPSVPSTEPDAELYGWLLKECPLQDTGRRYLQSRCIPASTITKFAVGQIGESTLLLQRAIREWGRDRLSKAGLLAESNYGERLVFPAGYLLFPFRSGSTVTYLQSRSISSAKSRRWFCPTKILPPIYNRDAIQSRSRTIAVCEGITDVLSADALKISAIGVLGAHGTIDNEAVAALSVRNVEIIADNDKAGEQFSSRILRALKSRGTTVVVKRIPSPSNDLNDYLISKRSQKK